MYVCFASFVAVRPSVCRMFCRASVWLVIYSAMSGRVCFIHYITNVFNTVSGVFVCLVRRVAACSPFTSTHCADAILCRCHLQGVPRSRGTPHGQPYLPFLHRLRRGLLLCGLNS